jgi:CRP-like cAMP-binding protein
VFFIEPTGYPIKEYGHITLENLSTAVTPVREAAEPYCGLLTNGCEGVRVAVKHINLFLESLSPESRNALLRLCVEVDLPLRKPLYEPGDTPQYAYFLTSGIASVVAMMEDGGMAEVGLIGREGVVGSFQLLGPAKVSTRCFIQLEATALRMRFTDLAHMFRTNEEIRDRVLEFVQEQAVSLGQLAGCNRLHGNEQRLARWLLTAQDRTHSDTLNFTQEFLAMMLGSRRTTVTLIAGVLQRQGLIRYQRGKVKILDRPNLEAASCDCYRIAKELYASLYSRPAPVAEMSQTAGVTASGGNGTGKAAGERLAAANVSVGGNGNGSGPNAGVANGKDAKARGLGKNVAKKKLKVSKG